MPILDLNGLNRQIEAVTGNSSTSNYRPKQWIALLALLTIVTPINAEIVERVVKNPPLLKFLKEPGQRTTLLTAPYAEIKGGAEKQLDLNIVYTEGKLYNPVKGQYDKLILRSYIGTDVNPETPFVSPTIEVSPGDTVRISLNNKLPVDKSCAEGKGSDINTPHCFNGTNLHSHGLWVSPAGNGDNVLLSINPGVSFQYQYNLPPDHPAGTFWYHTHRHGSTALQVSSGMAGALIVRGDRLPTEKVNGDIDTLLKNKDGSAMTERVLVLQQIQYACLNADPRKSQSNNYIEKTVDGNNVIWDCPANAPDAIYGVESYDQFGPGSWAKSGRYTSINGEILPTFKSAKAGVVERWRLIHAGVRDTIRLKFIRMKAGAPGFDKVRAGDAEQYIQDNCIGDPIPYHVIANDGLTRAAAWKTDLTTLQPGYRSDALVVFPEAGNYCVIDDLGSGAASVGQAEENGQLLGMVAVAPGSKVADIHDHLKSTLVAAAERSMPKSVRSQVIADLKDGLKFTRFIPHSDIADSEITGKQELAFFIDTRPKHPLQFEVSNDLGSNPDFKPYDPNRVDRLLSLGGVDEWTLQSRFVSHPFHIHVNPFQIVKILDPNGKDVSEAGAIDDFGGTADPQYPGMKGVWRDTLWVKSVSVCEDKVPSKTKCEKSVFKPYTLVVRTRYQRYIGEYVLHCHILDHEDQGMMQNVSIGIPSGPGNSGVTAHH